MPYVCYGVVASRWLYPMSMLALICTYASMNFAKPLSAIKHLDIFTHTEVISGVESLRSHML